MLAVLVDEPGDETRLRVGECEAPKLVPGSVRIRVAAAGVNRADLLQRQGFYPPPPGASTILGLECAGEVVEVAPGVGAWAPGDRAMALLSGGGYAQEVVVSAGSVMRVPAGLSYEQAAALPEALLTVFLNIFQLGGLPEGGAALVHGGGSGIGTAAIQLVKAVGGTCIVTAGSEEKCQRCLELGADIAVDYREGDFVAAAREATDGGGVDVVLDSIGAPYLAQNLKALAGGGRLVLIGLMGGAKAELPMGMLLTRRLQVIGSTLRTRSDAEKAELVSALLDRFGERIESGVIRPVVDRVLPLGEVAEAHRVMKASEHFGKIVLSVE
ncbi:MAG: NAD(P)H-quinone oxidoreductase [Deltaproteobacteria bacterium]|nr:NAD(P)H-quinone oxidoreductase [Deltaproteobacteria bacterium]MBW2420844.1 NAD(P)H-quinone oxidoreductase [Deltaproteobacteria bacterium]